MPSGTPTYPRHDQMKTYFQDYARHFDLYPDYQFATKVVEARPEGRTWQVTISKNGKRKTIEAAGLLIANGTLHKPKQIKLPGEFSGTKMHSAKYKSAAVFKDKRALIIGCGNSGCDIAVDAVHQAKSVDMVVRRGYYFLPKFVMGKAIDTLGGKIKLPNRLKQFIDGSIVKILVGKPSDYGLPDPDYRMYESHPVINSLVLHHIGHGDINVKPGIKTIEGEKVTFEDGSDSEYDIILEATGYELDYSFVDQTLLNWNGSAPQLYLNVFHPERNDIFLMGMVEAAGLGWQGRDEQAHLVALYLKSLREGKHSASKFDQIKKQQVAKRCDGGMNYLKLDRMSYYVHKGEYLATIRRHMKLFKNTS